MYNNIGGNVGRLCKECWRIGRSWWLRGVIVGNGRDVGGVGR